MLGKLKNIFGGDKKGFAVFSPMDGEAIALKEVSDPTFSEEILGKGIAIKPRGNRVLSPVNGTVDQMFDTGHAVSLISDEGAEVLVHVGLDTIKLKGEHYTKLAKDGDKVKVGDALIEFDRDKIAAAGYDTVTPIVICNSSDFAEVKSVSAGGVSSGDELLRIAAK